MITVAGVAFSITIVTLSLAFQLPTSRRKNIASRGKNVCTI
jgi:uncharacterized membrane protein